MDIKQIVKLNNEFYQLISKDFSRTRQKPWEGWGRVVKNIKKYISKEVIFSENSKEETEIKKSKPSKLKISVLDIGCGNGRFCEYVHDYFTDFSYTGIDINNDLLSEGKEKCKNLKGVKSKFLKKDIILDINKIRGKYDVLCNFGVTHHLPNDDFREKWFQSLLNLSKEVPESSMIVLTFWNFTKMPGDYLVSWGEGVEKPRYCHKYSSKEISDLIKMYKQNSFKLIDRYIADNKNLYLIFGKI